MQFFVPPYFSDISLLFVCSYFSFGIHKTQIYMNTTHTKIKFYIIDINDLFPNMNIQYVFWGSRPTELFSLVMFFDIITGLPSCRSAFRDLEWYCNFFYKKFPSGNNSSNLHHRKLKRHTIWKLCGMSTQGVKRFF